MKMKMGLGSKLDRRKNGKKGFTLVELIVVIVIILVLAGVMVPLLMNYIGQAKEAKMQSELATLHTVISSETAVFMAETGKLPLEPSLKNSDEAKQFVSQVMSHVPNPKGDSSNSYSIFIYYGEPGTAQQYDIVTINIEWYYAEGESWGGETWSWTSQNGWKKETTPIDITHLQQLVIHSWSGSIG